MNPIVIIGGGLAGYTVARELRKLDKAVPLILLMADDGAFYSKPMLSNGLAQKKTASSLILSGAQQMAGQLQADIRPYTWVRAIDSAAHRLELDGPEGSTSLEYSKLVLALGADTIHLPLSGDGAGAVLSVNDRVDYGVFREALEGKKKLALLGGGLIGCEFANDLTGAGFDVTVFDLAPQPLGRLLPPGAGRFMAESLGALGIQWRFGQSASRVEREGEHLRLTTGDGQAETFDLVLSAVGLRPRIALAQAAGIEANRGIVTDRNLRTSARDIHALGDCAEVAGLLLPFVLPLMACARALAATLAGTDTAVSYPAMPVVVKTPACPAVVCPPPMGAAGAWQEAVTATGVRALFRDGEGKLLGFALLGDAVAEKQALAAQLPAWL
ncbi:MAG: FAD-dependent oxidoreductase [Rhodocyclaceae bacterium]|nr:FAD-dependent oxidoreductase [Rhodocyclaceae bacterium]